MRIDTLEAQIREFIALRQAEFEKQQPGIEGFDGLAARMDALSALTDESPAMALANIFIMLLSIAIETAPIFVKLISPRGELETTLKISEEVLEGELFMPWHFSESLVNNLTRDELDPHSKIAPFKLSACKVVRN